MDIYTHDGTFHSDEVFAIALIKMFIKNNVNIIRTRDEFILNNAKSNKMSFVIDVGGDYNEKMKNFDHHQRSFKRTWKDSNILFSSCGLVWTFLKKKGYLKKHHPKVLSKIETNLIQKIDLHDNIGKGWKLVPMISKYNREENTIEDFEKAVSTAMEHLDNMFYHEELNRKKYEMFLEDLEKYDPSQRYFISRTTIKDSEVLNTISNETNALFLIYPQSQEGEEETWAIKSVNHYLENGQQVNLLAPREWQGEVGKNLNKKTHLKGLLFVHRSGFLMGVRTLNQAQKVAEYIILNKEKYQKFT